VQMTSDIDSGPQEDCPSCAGPLMFWSGYRCHVRAAGRRWKIFVPGLRCTPCRVSHALLPAFTLVWRLDVAETVGAVIGQLTGGACGVRPAVARLGFRIRPRAGVCGGSGGACLTLRAIPAVNLSGHPVVGKSQQSNYAGGTRRGRHDTNGSRAGSKSGQRIQGRWPEYSAQPGGTSPG
jgi:hypothetical protein